MIQFAVKPLYDSDWEGINDAEIGDNMEVIHCISGPGIKLPPVKQGKNYLYRGEYPYVLPTTPHGMPIFSVHEVEEFEGIPIKCADAEKYEGKRVKFSIVGKGGTVTLDGVFLVKFVPTRIQIIVPPLDGGPHGDERISLSQDAVDLIKASGDAAIPFVIEASLNNCLFRKTKP